MGTFLAVKWSLGRHAGMYWRSAGLSPNIPLAAVCPPSCPIVGSYSPSTSSDDPQTLSTHTGLERRVGTDRVHIPASTVLENSAQQYVPVCKKKNKTKKH